MTRLMLCGVGAILALSAAAVPFAWVASAPATPFRDSDFVRPATADARERLALYEVCLASKPPGVSPTRQLSVCTCQSDRITRDLNRAEFVYLIHVSRKEAREAIAVLKGFATAGRPEAEIRGAGERGAQALRASLGYCLQNSLTPADLERIRGRLEQKGVAPAGGTTRLDGR